MCGPLAGRSPPRAHHEEVSEGGAQAHGGAALHTWRRVRAKGVEAARGRARSTAPSPASGSFCSLPRTWMTWPLVPPGLSLSQSSRFSSGMGGPCA